MPLSADQSSVNVTENKSDRYQPRHVKVSVCWLFTRDTMFSTHLALCPSPEAQRRSKDDVWRPLSVPCTPEPEAPSRWAGLCSHGE